MKITIDLPEADSDRFNSHDIRSDIQIFNTCSSAVEQTETLTECFNVLEDVIENIPDYKIGKSGSHLWVCNWESERVLIITE